jgi:hypothetical protein
VTEPPWQIHPDNRQTNLGPVNAPAQDANASADMEGLLVALLLQIYGLTPTLPVGIANNPSNVAALVAYLGGSVSALLSSQLGVTVCPLNDDGDVPLANLSATAITLPLIGTGAPASGTGFAGDYWLDVDTGNLWGPKTSSTVWPGSAIGQVGGSLPGWHSQPIQASTSNAGYTMAATGSPANIITWTTPNDGSIHYVSLYGYMYNPTTAEVGGQINLTFTGPDGNARTAANVWSAAQATSANIIAPNGEIRGLPCAPNTAVTLTQITNTTSGGTLPIVWAALVGS